jgi:cap2 methyltransferase
MAEAPGAFVPSLNQYLGHYNIQWNWLAESYKSPTEDFRIGKQRNKNDSKSHEMKREYLEDHYGLIHQHLQNWYFGSENNGDIRSPANIRSFGTHIEKTMDSISLVTSDVRNADKNYDYEEITNMDVHLGQVVMSLYTLNKGGTMFIKTFTQHESMSYSILYLLSFAFTQLFITKPLTSRAANSEIYIVGLNYKKNISKVMFQRLFDILDYLTNLDVTSDPDNLKYDMLPALFPKSFIPQYFIDLVFASQEKLCDHQIAALQKNMEAYNTYKNRPNDIQRDYSAINEKLQHQWIELYHMIALSPERSLFTKHESF